MKPTSFALSCLLLLSLLLAMATVNEAIRDLPEAEGGAEEYWKKVMKNEPLPSSIKELVNDAVSSSSVDGKKKKLRFVKDFDTTTNAIIYHTTRHAAAAEKEQTAVRRDNLP
ncbi:hypothetical protein LINGRAHAP2_LOCUS26025 [Linum grandiflorum]